MGGGGGVGLGGGVGGGSVGGVGGGVGECVIQLVSEHVLHEQTEKVEAIGIRESHTKSSYEK